MRPLVSLSLSSCCPLGWPGHCCSEVPAQLWDIRAGTAVCETGFPRLQGTESHLKLAKAEKEIHWLGELTCPARVSGMVGLSPSLRSASFHVGLFSVRICPSGGKSLREGSHWPTSGPCAQFLKQSLVARGWGILIGQARSRGRGHFLPSPAA